MEFTFLSLAREINRNFCLMTYFVLNRFAFDFRVQIKKEITKEISICKNEFVSLWIEIFFKTG